MSQLFSCCCDKKESLTKSNSEVEELLWVAGTREACVCHGEEVWQQVAGVAAGARKLSKCIFNSKHKAEKINWKWQEILLLPQTCLVMHCLQETMLSKAPQIMPPSGEHVFRSPRPWRELFIQAILVCPSLQETIVKSFSLAMVIMINYKLAYQVSGSQTFSPFFTFRWPIPISSCPSPCPEIA